MNCITVNHYTNLSEHLLFRENHSTNKTQLTHPVVVHDGDDALKALADLHVNVMIEAWTHRTERRQRRPILLRR